MSTALDQPNDEWFTANSLRERFPSLQRLDEMALQRLATRAASIAERLGIPPRFAPQEGHHRYRAVQVHAYPLPVWLEARGVKPAPAGLEPVLTLYNEILYRSRLEARTAVWLTSMGWQFEYEKSHSELPSGRYLPDFQVLFEDDWTWFEVKHPRAFAEGRDPRWAEVVRRTHCDLIVSYGLWRPVPFKDSGPAQMFRGTQSGEYDVHWSEVRSLHPGEAAGEFMSRRLMQAYREAADERFGDDDGLQFAV
jgi:hypothetical protein